MATVSLGALSVEIRADTRKLKEGEEQVKKSTDRMEKSMNKLRDLALKLGAALAAAFTIRSIATFSKDLIDTADQMTKLARSAGTTVETLTALGHAASLSGMSVEELARAFRNVARNANMSLRAPSDFSRSLDALGVAWRDAEGNIRSADAIMRDVADRFEHMEDSATKTALAMRIFGEEMGPKLVNMLNQGSFGINQMTSEAERLGIVIDQQTGEAAERFNDAVTRLSRRLMGMAQDIAIKLTPTLERLAGILERLAGVGAEVRPSLQDLEDQMFKLTVRMGELNTVLADPKATEEAKKNAEKQLALIDQRMAKLELLIDLERQRIDLAAQGFQTEVFTPPTLPTTAEETNEKSDAQQRLNELLREGNRLLFEGRMVTEQFRQPHEELAASLERLGELYHHMAISADTAARAQTAAAALAANAYTGLAANVATSLSKIFNKNKAVAIAAAIANTAESITKTLAQYGGTPWGWANAAAAAAAGAAQIATIRRTSPSGGGTAPSTPTGGAVTPPAQPVDQTSPTRSPSTVLQVQTIGVGNLITREAFENILEQIMDYQRDGGTIILERV